MTLTYPSIPADRDRFVLDRRGRRETHDPFSVPTWVVDDEPARNGERARVATVFLTGRECPWRCLMCDLWRHTIESDTPPGAIPRQLAQAIAELEQSEAALPAHIKLYNAGSFLDPRAVPLADYPAIAAETARFQHVIVESHPALVAGQIDRLRDALAPATLEVAMGLETAHPKALERLNKRMTLDDFRRAADILAARDIGLRAFLLVHPPFVAHDEQEAWLERSVDEAFNCGASAVSLIPTRPGNGAVDALIGPDVFRQPRLANLERAFAAALARSRGRVFADLWDIGRITGCETCAASRRDRLARMNLAQRIEPRVTCRDCGGSAA